MDDDIEAVITTDPLLFQPPLVGLTCNPHLQLQNASTLEYVDILLDYSLGLYQRPYHRRRLMQRHILHALDKVFQPLDSGDVPQRK